MHTSSPRRPLAALLVALVAAAPAAAAAQPAEPQPYAAEPPPPQPQQQPPPRAGFLVGAALGPGSQEYRVDGEESASHDGLALAFHLGGMVNPRLALAVELALLTSTEQVGGPEVRINQRHATAWLRFWAMRRLWLQAGLGSARAWATVDGEAGETIRGATLTAAVGFEVLHRPGHAIDIALRFSGAGFHAPDDVDGELSSTTLALLAGFTWFP